MNKKIPFSILFLLLLADSVYGFGSMGPISASFGDNSLFCAIDASGKQAVICWDAKNSSSTDSNSLHFSTGLPPMAAISGGEGFLCGILVNTSQAYCWDSMPLSKTGDLVPDVYKPNGYSHLASGKDHVCAIRGSYYSEDDSGIVDCWDIVRASNDSLSSRLSSRFDANVLVFRKLVSGDGFCCGVVRDGGISCWGPNSGDLGISSSISDNFVSLASAKDSFCGVSEASGEVKCWGGNNNSSPSSPPVGIRFVLLAAGVEHFCGIREDNHGTECWGNFNESLIPKEAGFLAIASSDYLTCGIRESDLVLDCWFANMSSPADYDPPLELCSPGLCIPGSCREGMFTFNASLLNEPDLTSLCVRKDLNVCLPCGMNCSEGFFPSSSCSENADRICTSCSLCQNSSCSDICRLQTPPHNQFQRRSDELRQLLLIIGSTVSGFFLILMAWCFLPRVMVLSNEETQKRIFLSCIRKSEVESDANADQHTPASVAPCPGIAQVFRLSELKDATNGFKEFNELGRGSYGFVYKAILPDGRQVAVKRANAATIIHTNSRDFETELEILCNIRHCNIVNLLGYCAEMGERLLVYELMPHGTLHDHLHGGLSNLNWTLRLKIALQAAKGLEYLHTEGVPHRDMRSSKVLLDSDWVARIADFGLLTPSERDLNADMMNDIYGFGIVLLEILSGRKAFDEDCLPRDIVEWALPQIREGRAAAIIDRFVALPRNFEPLLKLADIAEIALRQDPAERAGMSDLVTLLDQIAKDGLI